MLIGIDSSPCSLSLRNRGMFNYEKINRTLKNVFVQKSFFFNIFYSFNPNHAYWNQRRLFSGNLPGMFSIVVFWSFRRLLRRYSAVVVFQFASGCYRLCHKETPFRTNYVPGKRNVSDCFYFLLLFNVYQPLVVSPKLLLFSRSPFCKPPEWKKNGTVCVAILKEE